MSEQPIPRNSHSQFPNEDIEFLDCVLQGLFGMGLKLEYCLSVLDDAPDQARAGLEGVVSGLDALAEPIRDEIRRRDRSRKLSQKIQC